MKMIKPIVNISKIIENFDIIIVGWSGVLSDGNGIRKEAADALIYMKKRGKRLVLLTNSPKRILTLAKELHAANVPPAVFDAIMSAGEILHYCLKTRSGDFASLGHKYYLLGSPAELSVFAGLDYERVDNVAEADFLYMGAPVSADDCINNYLPVLEHAAGLGLPFVCAGNDTSCFIGDKVCIAPAALAEQYAVLGGKIITLGKPDSKIISYCLDGFDNLDKNRTLLIGDNIMTDIKGANLVGIPAVLVSKGVHVNFLGEGYIPDVAKTREIANNYDAYPDYVISNLRW